MTTRREDAFGQRASGPHKDVPSDEVLKEMYPEVDDFAAVMRRELWTNRTKGTKDTWREDRVRDLTSEVFWHAAKLAMAVKHQDPDLIREHAADVANMAMMVEGADHHQRTRGQLRSQGADGDATSSEGR